jgi:hypothetical protein
VRAGKALSTPDASIAKEGLSNATEKAGAAGQFFGGMTTLVS